MDSSPSPLSQQELDERLKTLHSRPANSNMAPRRQIQHKSEQKMRDAVMQVNEILRENGIEVHGSANQLLAFVSVYRYCCTTLEGTF